MTVQKLQWLLKALNYDPGEVDGISGKRTREAVRAFQRDYGMAADGIAGEKTQNALRQAIFDDWKRPAGTAPAEKKETGTWWDGIRYFTRADPYIGCSCGKCGGFPAEPSEKLMRLADRVREAAGRPMLPTSTVRCRTHNAEVGGVGNSRHLTGNAMDFCIPGLTSRQILSLVRAQKETAYSYAIDGTHVHMDVV